MRDPKVFATIGDTDFLDVTDKALNLSADTSLRVASYNSSATSYQRIAGRKVISVAELIGAPRYIEFGNLSGSHVRMQMGIAQSTLSTVTGATATGAKNVVYRGNGWVHNDNSTATQTLTSLAYVKRVGVLVTAAANGVDCVAQFSLDGVDEGTAETLVLDGVDIRAVIGAGDSNVLVQYFPDFDDQLHRPAGAQPWGAAARVSDVSGYSADAAYFTITHADTTILPDKKTASSITNGRTAIMANARAIAAGLVYVEYINELDVGSGPMAGLTLRTHATASFPGQTADSWGFYGNGRLYNNSTSSYLGTLWNQADRFGFIWNKTTQKLWVSINGTVLAGDPEAGTGESASSVTGDLVPAVAPYAGNRVRICTHANEQLYRPSYAKPWEAVDQLPKLWHRGALSGDVTIKQEVSFPLLWSQYSGKKGAPLGTISLLNSDGYYDAIRDYPIRDSAVTVYSTLSGVLAYEAKVFGEKFTLAGFDTLQLYTRGSDSALDVRAPEGIFTIGYVEAAPMPSDPDTPITYRVSNWPQTGFAVHSGGLLVNSFTIGVDADGLSATRTVSPSERQTARFLSTIKNTSMFTSNFTAWAADDPTDWTTVNENGTTSKITQVGNAARFYRSTGAPACSLEKSGLTLEGGSQIFVEVEVVVSAYVEGDLAASLLTTPYSYDYHFGITGPGTYKVFMLSSSFSETLTLAADDVTDLTVDSVQVNKLLWVSAGSNTGVTYSINTIMGAYAPNVAYSFQGETSGVLDGIVAGYWSDKSPLIRSVLDELCASSFADYYQAADGSLVFVIFPIGATSAVLGRNEYLSDVTSAGSVVERDVYGAIRVETDLAQKLSDTTAYKINYAVHTDAEVVGSVSDAERARFTSPYAKHKPTPVVGADPTDVAEVPPLHPFYNHAIDGPPLKTLRALDGITGAAGLGLGTTATANPVSWTVNWSYSVIRNFYIVPVSTTFATDYAPGQVLEVTHGRYGLSATPLFLFGVERGLLSGKSTLRFWG